MGMCMFMCVYVYNVCVCVCVCVIDETTLPTNASTISPPLHFLAILHVYPCVHPLFRARKNRSVASRRVTWICIDGCVCVFVLPQRLRVKLGEENVLCIVG